MKNIFSDEVHAGAEEEVHVHKNSNSENEQIQETKSAKNGDKKNHVISPRDQLIARGLTMKSEAKYKKGGKKKKKEQQKSEEGKRPRKSLKQQK